MLFTSPGSLGTNLDDVDALKMFDDAKSLDCKATANATACEQLTETFKNEVKLKDDVLDNLNFFLATHTLAFLLGRKKMN